MKVYYTLEELKHNMKIREDLPVFYKIEMLNDFKEVSSGLKGVQLQYDRREIRRDDKILVVFVLHTCHDLFDKILEEIK